MLKFMAWKFSPALVVGTVLFMPASVFAAATLQGSTLDFAQGGSSMYDTGDLHVVTDDILYLQAKDVSVSNRLDVSGDLVAHYPLYLQGNLLKFGGGAPTVIDFNQDGARIWESGGAMHTSTSGIFYVQSPTLSLSRDLDVTNNSRVRNNLQVDGNLTVAGNLSANLSFTDLAVTGNQTNSGTLAVAGATTLAGAVTTTGTSTMNGNVALGTDTSNTVSVNGIINTAVILGNAANKTIKVGDDSASTGAAGKNLTISASNRTAGTGNGGNLVLNAGSSSGGTAGTITVGSTGSAVTITPATTITGAATLSSSLLVSGASTLRTAGGNAVQVTATSAPTASQLSITNSGFASATNSVSGLDITNVVTGATNNNGINISPTYTGGATDGLVYHAINISDGAPANAAGNDIYVGTNFADLTDPGASIISVAMYIGSGWDASIAIKDSSSFVLADGSANSLLTVTDAGTTGNLSVSGTTSISGATTLKSSVNYAATTHSTNAYSLAVALGSLTDGQMVLFKADAGSTGAATLNVNSTGAKKMIKGSDNATQIDTGDIVINGSYMAVYNSSLDTGTGAWVIMNK